MRTSLAVPLDAAVWAAWGTAVGYACARLPASRFEADGRLTRIRAWERDGRIWERVGVRRWKDRLPELGALFGGVSKRTIPGGRDGLARLAVETRRAEVVHWLAALPVLALPWWTPPWASAVMAAYAFVANAPCIVVQRYNRGRIERLMPREMVVGR